MESRSHRNPRKNARKDPVPPHLAWEDIFHAIGHPAVILDPHHRVIAANHASTKLTGKLHSEIIGKQCYEIFHGQDAHGPAQGCPMEQMLKSGTLETIEMEMETLAGTFLVSCTPVFDDDGNLNKVIHIATDITGRKKIDDAQLFLVECGSKGDDFFQSLAHYLAKSLEMDYVCIDKLEGDLMTARTVAVYADGKFEDNVSYTLHETPCGEVVGRDVCCFPEGVRHRFPKDTVLQDMKAESYVGVTLWSHDHRPIGLIAVIGRRLLKDPQAAESILKLAAVRASGELERRRTEEELRTSEQEYRLLFMDNPMPMWIYNVESLKILNVNEAAVSHYGYTRNEFLSMTLDDIRPQEDVAALHDTVSHLPAGISRSGIWRHRRKDGTLIWVEIHSHGIVYEGRRSRLVLSNDITERKKMEAEVLKAQTLESIGILAGGIAHDFNNLLQAMMGNISLAKMLTNPKEKTFPLLEEAEKASEQAKELSYRFLTFSKGGDPVRSIVSLEEMLKNCISLSLSGSNVACELSIPKDLYLLEMDKGQMNQVFHSLLTNAKEAMPDGGTVEIRASNVTIAGSDNLPLKEGPYVKISVADHGSGISQENLPRIFDPYFSTKDRGSEKGMGLGLAICHSIITKHEGHISVESGAGAGAVFHIYLPASPKNIAGGDTLRKGHLSALKGRVLFMDDDERVRRIAGAMLQQLGYSVEFAKNGEEAIERYRREKESGKRIDAVILDLTVQGGMGGEKALRQLLEIDPEVKAVISSGYTDDPVMTNFRAYRFLAAIAKPYSIEKLMAVLKRLEHDI